MYFEKDKFESRLKCSYCNARFSSLHLPKLLPCGDSMCANCVGRLRKINEFGELIDYDCGVDSKNWRVKCPICLQIHDVPLDGYPTQKLILELVSLPATRVRRSNIYEVTEKVVGNLESKLNTFVNNLYNTNTLSIWDDTRESATMSFAGEKLDKFKDTSINEVNEEILYNKMANCGLDEAKCMKDRYKESVVKYRNEIDKWKLYLNKAESDEEHVKLIHDNAIELDARIDNELKLFDNNYVFNGNNDPSTEFINNNTNFLRL